MPENINKSVLPSELLEEWSKLKSVLEDLHRQRKKQDIVEAMKKGIDLFLQFLLWCNGKPVSLNNFPVFADLQIKPVNLEERAGFIVARPGLYHSFVQLCELMIEQEKLWAKEKTIKNTRGVQGFK